MGKVGPEARDDRIPELRVRPVDALERLVVSGIRLPLVTDHLAAIVAVADLPPHRVAREQQCIAALEDETVEVLASSARPVLAVPDDHHQSGAGDLGVVVEIAVRAVLERVRKFLQLDPLHERVGIGRQRTLRRAPEGDNRRSIRGLRVHAAATGGIVGSLGIGRADDDDVRAVGCGRLDDERHSPVDEIDAAPDFRNGEGRAWLVAEPGLPGSLAERRLRSQVRPDRLSATSCQVIEPEAHPSRLHAVQVQGGAVARPVGKLVGISVDHARDHRGAGALGHAADRESRDGRRAERTDNTAPGIRKVSRSLRHVEMILIFGRPLFFLHRTRAFVTTTGDEETPEKSVRRVTDRAPGNGTPTSSTAAIPLAPPPGTCPPRSGATAPRSTPCRSPS
jgi:hypothetical protein